jgi:hypothetical protein
MNDAPLPKDYRETVDELDFGDSREDGDKWKCSYPPRRSIQRRRTVVWIKLGDSASIDGQTGKPLSTPTTAFTIVQADLNDDGVQYFFIGR